MLRFNLEDRKNNFEKNANVISNLIVEHCSCNKPLVSIMIPTFKRPHLIKESIESAAQQITECSFEVVIVDNDHEGEFFLEIKDIVNSFENVNIRYFKNSENIGMFGNWNRCIELARGSYFTILNDDDLLFKSFLTTVMKNIDGVKMIATERSVFYGSSDSLSSEEFSMERKKVRNMEIKDLFNGRSYSASLGILFHKKTCIELGGYNDELFPTSDLDFNNRYLYQYGQKELCSKLSAIRRAENESLNASTIHRFIVNDHIMWSQYFEKLSSNKKGFYSIFFFTLLNLRTIQKGQKYCSINSDFNLGKALQELNMQYDKKKLAARIIPRKLIDFSISFIVTRVCC